MTITVDFDTSRAYVGNRPVGDVVLHGPGGSHGTTWAASALVDTGADYMHVPDSAVTGVGILTTGATRVRVSTGSGPATFWQIMADVEIEGVTVNIPINFGPNVPALIGRQAIFKVLEKTGFTTADWLLKWKAGTATGP
jgi:predicted aspartyl protease